MKSIIISMFVMLISLSRSFGVEDLVNKDQSRVVDNKFAVGTRCFEGVEILQISYVEKERKGSFCVLTITGDEAFFDVVPETRYWVSCSVKQTNKNLNVVIQIKEKGVTDGMDYH